MIVMVMLYYALQLVKKKEEKKLAPQFRVIRCRKTNTSLDLITRLFPRLKPVT